MGKGAAMRVEFYQPADEHERYDPHAFDRLLGQEAPFKIGGVEHGRATVVAVMVDEDGRGATWTVDIPIDAAGSYRVGPISGFTGDQWASFAFREDPEIPERWWD